MVEPRFGVERLLFDLAVDLEDHVRLQYQGDHVSLGITSPIEKLFLVALHVYCESFGRGLALHVQYGRSQSYSEPRKPEHLLITPQAVIFDGWPIDFVITTQIEGDVHKIAVECDGHDFHERTKEQAARDRQRDRKLQEIGFRVFRFTGSEIYRNAFKCAKEVYDSIEKAWIKHP